MNDLPRSLLIRAALPKVESGFGKYCWLQANLAERDVATDVEFQRRFGGFYRVRRNSDWRRAYFRILQNHKRGGLGFSEALRLIHKGTGRLEASFASKLVATLDPHQPVIDSVVLGHAGLRLPARTAANRFDAIVNVHDQLAAWYRQQLASPLGREAIGAFRKAYPKPKVTRTKALDLILWQIR